MSSSTDKKNAIFNVFCYNHSHDGDAGCFLFYVTDVEEDAIQVALNLHRGCNTPHRIQVFDTEAVMSVLTLFSPDYE